MSKELVASLSLLWICSLPATAADLCNCCGGSAAAACASACQTVEPAAGQCIPTVDFESRAEVGPGKNALYEFSWRNLQLGKTDRNSLEAFRRLLEKLRRGAETDRKAAIRERRHGAIDDFAAKALAERYDDAIVNYYLGTQAYRLAKKVK